MKATIDIYCTPEKARLFLGLPDLDEIHQVTHDATTKRMRSAPGDIAPEAQLKNWPPGSVRDSGELKKSFGVEFTGAGEVYKNEKGDKL